MKYDIILIERPLDTGLTKDEYLFILDHLCQTDRDGDPQAFIPIEVENIDNSVAIGLATFEAADYIGFDTSLESEFGQFVKTNLFDTDDTTNTETNFVFDDHLQVHLTRHCT